MSTFFSKFQQIPYDFSGNNTNVRLVTNLTHHVKMLDIILQSNLILYPYFVQDGETPEIIASKLYGSEDYYWIVMFCNDIQSRWDDWPLSYDQFIAYLNKKYGSVPASQSLLDHYEDKYGNRIDLDTYNANTSNGAVRVYAYDYEVKLNEAKKGIRLIDASYVRAIETQLNTLLTPVKRPN
jgi:hypothetical protein